MDFIKWFGHASFSFVDKISGNRIYYIDPFDLGGKELEPADLVFITHAHQDHFSPDDLDLIMHDETRVIAPPDILENMGRNKEFGHPVLPNNSYTIDGFSFSTIPAYNIPPKNFHPRENNWIGYIFTVSGKKIYHAGDTDFTLEMKALKEHNLDIAMLPIGGKFTMDYKEAAEAANYIGAKVTIPMHYKNIVGEKASEIEEEFKSLVTASEVVVL